MAISLTSIGVTYPDNSTETTGVCISGPAVGSSIAGVVTFTITDYDAYTTYTLSTSNGTVTRSGNTISYTPTTIGTNNGSFTINGRTIGPFSVAATLTYLVVAGGGGGGNLSWGNGAGSAGGGGGGVLYNENFIYSLGVAYSIQIGAGGTSPTTGGVNGSTSKFNTYIPVGGGAGGNFYAYNSASAGLTGGSGGGGVGYYYNDVTTPGSGTSGQGYSGGSTVGWSSAGNRYVAGGGGGAGGAGANGTSSGAGAGGIGIQLSITGTATYYAGGGGGSYIKDNGTDLGLAGRGLGGAGGGGNGVYSAASNTGGSAGTVNTGGGGGSGFAGGSGVVILKIPSSITATFSAGVTSSLSTAVAGFKIYTITAAGATDTVTFS